MDDNYIYTTFDFCIQIENFIIVQLCVNDLVHESKYLPTVVDFYSASAFCTRKSVH